MNARSWSGPLAALFFSVAAPFACQSGDGAPDDSHDGMGAAGGQSPSMGGTTNGSGGDSGENPPDDEIPSGVNPISGSRIKQIWLEGGGVKRAERLFDQDLGVDCRFETMVDGSLRCAPLNSEAVVFTDSGCTQALLPDYEGDCGEKSSRFSGVYRPSGSCEPNVYEAFRATESVETPTTIYRLSRGECVAEDANPADEYFAAETIAPSDLVEARRVVGERTNLLGVGFFASTDGGYFYEGPVNLDRQASCAATEIRTSGEEPAHFCFVEAALRFEGGSYGFSDSACSDAVARAEDSCVEPEVVIGTEMDGDGCFVNEVLEVESELMSVFVDDAGDCVSESVSNLSPAGRRYSVGGSAEDLVELRIASGEEGESLATRHYVSGGESVQVLGQFWHQDQDAACNELRLPSGDRICVPGRYVNLGSEISSGIFADDQCTREVVFGGNASPCTSEEDFAFIVAQPDDACDAPGTIYEAGETFVTNTIYSGSGDSCTAQVNDDDGFWVEVGRVLDRETDFIRLTERTDD